MNASDASAAPPADDGRELLFVIGLPHAGAQAVARVLALDPDVQASPAPWLMLPLAYMLTWHGSDADYDAFAARRGLQALAEALPAGVDDIRDALRSTALTLYRKALAKSGRRVFVDASPRYERIVPFLADLFPAARFVVALRNPAAVLRAHLDAWCDGKPANLRLHEDLYRDLVEGPPALAAAIDRLGARAIVVYYEDWHGDEERLADLLAAGGMLPDRSLRPDQASAEGAATTGAGPSEEAATAAALRKLAGDEPHAGLLACAQSYLDHLGHRTLGRLGYGAAAHGLALAMDCGEAAGLLLQSPLPALHGLAGAAESDADGLNAAGENLAADGRLEDAAAAFLHAAQALPARAMPLSNLGAVLWQKGQRPLALWCFARAAQVEPGCSAAWLNACDALAACGQRKSAKALLAQLLVQRPDDQDVMHAYLQADG